ncbi:MAG: DUF3109 family protein [Ignavibacteriales bacterium]|nr:DUF3109 family protein [Ignavibacteriales bacterium]
MNPEFLEIEKVFINKEIIDTNFTCDLSKCKGACCTMESEFGAPLTENEIEQINKILPVVMEYLPKEHNEEIEKKGFWIEKQDDLMTRSLNNRACVFVTWDGDIAKCGIEKAYRDGKIDFIKPVSCHLFPIRVSKFGGDVLRFEKYSECQPALEKGNKTQIKIIDFCRESLEREYGKEWFSKTKKSVDD